MVAWAVSSFGVAVGAFWMGSRFLLAGRKRGRVGIAVGAVELMLGTAITIGALSPTDVTMFVRPLILLTQMAVGGLIGYEGRMATEAVDVEVALRRVEQMEQEADEFRSGS